jgi:hypothetical protein
MAFGTLAIGMSRYGYDTAVGYMPDGAHAWRRSARARRRSHACPGRSTRRDEPAEFILLPQTNRKPNDGPPLNPDEEATDSGPGGVGRFELLINGSARTCAHCLTPSPAPGRSRRRRRRISDGIFPFQIQLFGHALATKGAGAAVIPVRLAQYAVAVDAPA